MSQRLKLGEIVLRAGVVDAAQLEAALCEQKKWGGRLGLILVRMGFVSEPDLVQALAGQLDLPVATLEGKKIPRAVLDLVPGDFADSHTCLPLFRKRDAGIETLYVATDDPSNLDVLDDLAFRTGMRVKPVVVATSEICEAVDRFYRGCRDLEPDPQLTGSESLPAAGPPPLACDEGDLGDGEVRAEATPAVEGEKPAVATDREPSTRLVLHALTQILIERGIMSRDEFYQRVSALSAADEGDPTEE